MSSPQSIGAEAGEEVIEEITTENIQQDKDHKDDPSSADVRAYFHPSNWGNPLYQGSMHNLAPAWYGATTNIIEQHNIGAMAFLAPTRATMGKGNGAQGSWAEPSSSSSTPQVSGRNTQFGMCAPPTPKRGREKERMARCNGKDNAQ